MPPDEEHESATRPLEPPLPKWLRLVLFAVGSLLVAFGLVALALPVVPQALPLAIGAALLSLASDRVYHALRTRLRRFPWAWKPVRAFRQRAHRLFSGRRSERDDD